MNKRKFGLKYTMIGLGLTTLSVFASFDSATAMPLVYSCKIIDYTSQGVEVMEFLYTEVGHSSTFTSQRSSARVYLDKNHRLVLSLRPLRTQGSNSDTVTYTTVTAFDLPQRLQVVLGEGTEETGYSAMLNCQI